MNVVRSVRPGAPRVRAAALGLLLGVVLPAGAACNAQLALTRPDSRYQVVAGTAVAGSEVLDRVTGLIWQRCVLGMNWDGRSCSGSPSLHSWPQALAAAQSAAPSLAPGAAAWRLPDMKELISLVDKACVAPSINSRWFPAAPAASVWSASPFAGQTGSAWVVGFDRGYHGTVFNSSTLQVRLVRSAP